MRLLDMVKIWWHAARDSEQFGERPDPWRRGAAIGLAVALVLSAILLLSQPRLRANWRDAERARETGTATGLARLEKEVADNPASIEARLALAGVYLSQNRLQEATRQYRTAWDLERKANPTDPNVAALLGLSIIASRLDDPASALKLAEGALRWQPDDLGVQNRLIVALAEAGKPEQAERTLQEAIQRAPGDPILMLNAAHLAAGRGEWAKAEEYCRQAAAALPNSSQPGLVLASYLTAQGKLQEALAELDALARKFPRDARVPEAKGRVHLLAKRPREARDSFVQAQQLSPRWPLPYAQAAQVSIQLGDDDAAIRDFQKAVELEPSSRSYRMGLADIFIRRAEYDRATPLYEEILTDDPNNAIALNNLAYVYAETDRNLDKAREMIEQVLSVLPDKGSSPDPLRGLALDTLGWVHYQAGRNRQAVATLKQATVLAPGDGRVHYHLGKALLEAGRPDEAADSLRKAIELGLPAALEQDARAVLNAD